MKETVGYHPGPVEPPIADEDQMVRKGRALLAMGER